MAGPGWRHPEREGEVEAAGGGEALPGQAGAVCGRGSGEVIRICATAGFFRLVQF